MAKSWGRAESTGLRTLPALPAPPDDALLPPLFICGFRPSRRFARFSLVSGSFGGELSDLAISLRSGLEGLVGGRWKVTVLLLLLMPSPGGEGLFCSMYKHNQTSKPHKGDVGQPLFLIHYIEAGNSAKGRPVTASSQDPDPQELTLLPQLEVLAYKQAYGLVLFVNLLDFVF
ncbi:putative serine carboxypeptidase CPVL [Manis javanica]|nr:putative serine carboxypeptidase CPVL [Manis javanica]